MDGHIQEFFGNYAEGSPTGGGFHKVISLHEGADVGWEAVSKLDPKLPRGWYELCQLPVEDRVQFIGEFWLSKLPFHPGMAAFIEKFFADLDDVGVYVTQKQSNTPFRSHMVYSIRGNEGFYRGATPATPEQLIGLQELVPESILPPDYIAFLEIHNGFWKSTDCTGIHGTVEFPEFYQDFKDVLEASASFNPNSLIPFYQSFGMPFYQCFWSEWHPEEEMGNIYFSLEELKLPNVQHLRESKPEKMAFATFSDWLIFYLEKFS